MQKLRRAVAIAIGLVVILLPISARADACATCKSYWQAQDAGIPTANDATYGPMCTYLVRKRCQFWAWWTGEETKKDFDTGTKKK
jgi:hypothetical protein